MASTPSSFDGAIETNTTESYEGSHVVVAEVPMLSSFDDIEPEEALKKGIDQFYLLPQIEFSGGTATVLDRGDIGSDVLMEKLIGPRPFGYDWSARCRRLESHFREVLVLHTAQLKRFTLDLKRMKTSLDLARRFALVCYRTQADNILITFPCGVLDAIAAVLVFFEPFAVAYNL